VRGRARRHQPGGRVAAVPILSDSICMAAGDLSDNNQTPLMSRFCDGFQDAAQILELG